MLVSSTMLLAGGGGVTVREGDVVAKQPHVCGGFWVVQVVTAICLPVMSSAWHLYMSNIAKDTLWQSEFLACAYNYL